MPGWTGVAQAYAETFAPLCAGAHDEVLAAAGLGGAGSPGLRVLDVGAGTGDLAARALRSGARVTAVEPDADMLAIARAAAPGATFARAGLPALPFSGDGFDAVVAAFVVNHVPDPRRAVRELTRVAAPGARVVVTIWPSGHHVQSRLWAEVIESSGALVPPSVRLPAAMDFARTRDGLADLLTGAGLSGVDARSITWTHRAEVDSLWRGAAAGVGGIGSTVVAQAPEVRRAMKHAYDRLIDSHLEAGRLRLDTEALIAVGTA